MLKLKRYLKPYWMLLICAVAFLFGQAMLELTLPNMTVSYTHLTLPTIA